jgi:hypothetical protein
MPAFAAMKAGRVLFRPTGTPPRPLLFPNMLGKRVTPLQPGARAFRNGRARATLHIRLDPLPAPRHTAAIDELCHALNAINTVYPGTGLTLRYSIKSHR